MQHLAVRVALPIALCSFVLGLGSALARADAEHAEIGHTSVFATLPFPGHPFGIAVDDDKIYVDTSRGDFFASQTNSAGERLFVLNKNGHILQTVTIPTMPDATMGLWGLALDGSHGRDHRLFVADMNGRILRVNIAESRPTFDVFSTPPPPFDSGDWHTTMERSDLRPGGQPAHDRRQTSTVASHTRRTGFGVFRRSATAWAGRLCRWTPGRTY